MDVTWNSDDDQQELSGKLVFRGGPLEWLVAMAFLHRFGGRSDDPMFDPGIFWFCGDDTSNENAWHSSPVQLPSSTNDSDDDDPAVETLFFGPATISAGAKH